MEQPSLIERVQQEPFYGAARYLRSIDPLYQAEIGEERLWEVKIISNSHGCDCCYCEEKIYRDVVAITAADAVAIAEDEAEDAEFVVGVRLSGAWTEFADPDHLGVH